MIVSTPAQSPAEMYALAVLLPLTATLFVGLRFRARYLRHADIGWDDWLLVVSLFFTYLIGIFMIVATSRGDLAEHMVITAQGPVEDEKYTVFLKMLYGVQVTQTVAIGLTKIAVLLLYRRIFVGKWFNIIDWTFIGIMIGWTTAFTLGNLFECIPISQSFINAPGLDNNPHCDNTVPMYMAQVYIDTIMDVLILILPIPLVWRLQLATRQKIAVCGMFLLGFITTMSSAAKMIVYYLIAAEMTQVPDQSWFLTPVIYWGVIESSLQIIAACLPLLRPVLPKWFERSEKSSYPKRSLRTYYSDITANRTTELSPISISRPIHHFDPETGLPKTSGYSSDESHFHNTKEIYVQQTFNAEVKVSAPAPTQHKHGAHWSSRQADGRR